MKRKIQRALIGFIIGAICGPLIVIGIDAAASRGILTILIGNKSIFGSFIGGISGATLGGISDTTEENVNAAITTGAVIGAIVGAIGGAIFYIFIGVANPTIVYSPFGALVFFGGVIGALVDSGIAILFSSLTYSKSH